MLINDSEQYVRTAFSNEAEIESVVQKYAERLFGSSIIYLPQKRISTLGGKNTVPDAIVIDVESEEWFIVEAERAVHGTWDHIAPQISKQIAAVATAKTRQLLVEIALKTISQSKALRALFLDLGIGELEVHGRIHGILQKTPTIAIPIDGIPKDLKEWAQTLRHDVKIWMLEKYAPIKGSGAVLYSIPDENLPSISTESSPGGDLPTVTTVGSQPYQTLINAHPSVVGETVYLEYGPRGKPKKTFQGTVKEEGIEVEGHVYSPSYAAVYCIQKAGSPRKTANGWVMWKTKDGQYLNDLYRRFAKQTSEPQADAALADVPLVDATQDLEDESSQTT
jgi:hypothetical protein